MYWRTVNADMPRSETTFFSPSCRTLPHGTDVLDVLEVLDAVVAAGAAVAAGAIATRTTVAESTAATAVPRRWRGDMGGTSQASA
ncbi:hypothetical protein GCM10022399_42570 [Terrabacter ginsenosidimutans]|uniref:Uncharacterized protein n=1 Tax=Terrabacter ginsenosidimutans TaxID=490575 RepID=A0ABP7EPI9_9MICO